MAKRFTDTDKWRKSFIKSLPAKYKLLWFYITDDCNHAGIWHVDIEVASIRIGEDLNKDEVINTFGEKIIPFDNGEKWYIPSFVEFQYGELNDKNRVHASVIKELSKYNLLKNKPLTSPLQGVKDKDMDKDMDKDKEGVKEKIIISNDTLIFKIIRTFKELNPEYPLDTVKDATSSLQIIYKICVMNGWDKNNYFVKEPDILEKWKGIAGFIVSDKWFSTRALYDINNEWQRVIQTMNSKKGTEPERKETNNLHARMKDLVKNNHG